MRVSFLNALSRSLSAWTKLRTVGSALVLSVLAASYAPGPAIAQFSRLGVVRTPENEGQWSVIVNRLSSIGVNYCVLDLRKWRRVEDLPAVQVMLLPNVELVNGLEANLLEAWVGRGGRTIVTGPTGILAEDSVQSRLSDLFGASWQYSLSRPAPLEVEFLDTYSYNADELSAEILGGAIQTQSPQSNQVAAYWLLGEPLPAVVTSDNNVYLGWRWGTDGGADPAVDVAWMKIALQRQGIYTSNVDTTISPSVTTTNPQPCLASQLQEKPQGPILPNTLKQASPKVSPKLPHQSLPSVDRDTKIPQTQSGVKAATKFVTQSSPIPSDFPVTPTAEFSQSALPAIAAPIPGLSSQLAQATQISNYEIRALSQELEALIARFESALLAADAGSSGIEPSTNQTVQQLLEQGTTRATISSSSVQVDSYARRAVNSARQSLQQFLTLAEQRDYTAAKQQWFQARRTLWQNYPTQFSHEQSEVRAIWLDRGTIVRSRSEADLAKVFDRLAKSGINTVFFETLNASYPIYPSKIAPEQNPLTKGWDPLKAAVKLAHERGMELHAWVWTFAAANQRHNLVLGQPTDYLGPVLSTRPSWALTNRSGKKFHYNSKKAFLDPANPQVQRYLLSLLSEIATNYDVDGIQLDYIRYSFQGKGADQSYGYSAIARQKFQKLTGVDPITMTASHPLWNKWTSFRIQQVSNFVAAASQVLQQQRPEIVLSTAVFPIPRHKRLTRIQQYWEEWARNGWVDMVVLMTYALDTGNLEERTRPLYAPEDHGSSLLMPGIRLLNVPDPVTVDQVQFLRNLPTGGYALFAAVNLTPNLERIFNRTQGTTTSESVTPLPYRQPFQAAESRYQALQQEWSFLIAQQQIQMSPEELQAWGNQADKLAIALQKVAQDPSASHILAAKNEVIRFRRNFKLWMQPQRRQAPYQVQAWENRLDTLAQLLNYGERLVATGRYAQVSQR